MNKKSVAIISVILAGIILSSFMVSAAEDAGMSALINQISGLVESIYNSALQPLAGFLIGSASKDAENFFMLMIMLVILLSLLYEITGRVPIFNSNAWIQFIISLGVSLISIRFLATQAGKAWFEAILLPNRVLGITLLCIIPLVIFWFFVMDVGSKSKTLAKILWIFSAIVFASLYLTRVDEIQTAAGAGKFNPAIIYLLTAVASIIFLLFDGTFRSIFARIRGEKLMSAAKKEHLILWQKKLADINTAYQGNTSGYISTYVKSKKKGFDSYNADLEYVRKQIEKVAK